MSPTRNSGSSFSLYDLFLHSHPSIKAKDMKQRMIISIVNEGEHIPFDGIVCEGLALVDESAETGVSTSQLKEKGNEVQAGSLVMQGWLKIESPLDAKSSNKAKEAPAQFALLGITLTLIGMTLAILFALLA